MFQQDNAFIVFLNKLADMVILSVLFCLCCLPVFTIGAADAALYHTVVKVLGTIRAMPLRRFGILSKKTSGNPFPLRFCSCSPM